MRNATHDELAYCAGVIDSDGCISILKNKRKGGTPSYSLVIMLMQIQRDAIDLFAELFGGNVKLKKNSTKHFKNTQPIWMWRREAAKAAEIIRQLQPFLRIKTTQAAIALELNEVNRRSFESFMASQRGRVGRARPGRDPKFTDLMESLYVAGKAANSWKSSAIVLPSTPKPKSDRGLFGDVE